MLPEQEAYPSFLYNYSVALFCLFYGKYNSGKYYITILQDGTKYFSYKLFNITSTW